MPKAFEVRTLSTKYIKGFYKSLSDAFLQLYTVLSIFVTINVCYTSQEISPLNIKELQTVHSMRAKATEASNPDMFTPKGKTAAGGIKRKRPESMMGKENIPANKVNVNPTYKHIL